MQLPLNQAAADEHAEGPVRQCNPGAQSEDLAGISRLFRRYGAGLLGAGLCAALLLTPAFSSENDTAAKAKKSAGLTEEEKEIIKELELLENLTLLQDLEAIDFLDMLNEMNPEWAEEAEPAEEADGKEGGESK
jgi:hypothetical protein